MFTTRFTMSRLILIVACLSATLCFGKKPDMDPRTITIYVMPFYNSEGEHIAVGEYSEGLRAPLEEFLSTIHTMKGRWDSLTVEQLHVGAIQLYNRGYRHESVYWYYTAQLRSRVFMTTLDPFQIKSPGEPGYEHYHAQNAFLELIGPHINQYAFGDLKHLVQVLNRTKRDGVPDLMKVYPDVYFQPKRNRDRAKAEVLRGLDEFLNFLRNNEENLKAMRIKSGVGAQFDHLENLPLPASGEGS